MADAHPARRAHTPWPRSTLAQDTQAQTAHAQNAQAETDEANAPAARGVAPLFVVPPEGLDLDLAFDEATRPAVPHTPEAWGTYRITRLLGQGRLGAVYEAFADAHQAAPAPARAVALHVLPLDADPQRRAALEQLFTQAVQQAAALSHPHIAQVRGTAAVEQGVYMACEWLQGRSLSAAWQAGWQASPVEAALLTSRLADGLAHAHARGVVHGGISPGTVFLTEGGQPKVLGTGWAAAASASNLPELDPLVAGTAHYLAPEQLQGGAVDARTDVHALGALLFELLAARQAFAGNTVPQVVQALQKHAPLAPHLGSPDVPQRLSEMAMRALEREPGNRYPSAAALSVDLQDWLRSVKALPASAGAGAAASAAAAASPSKRRWLAAALAAAACAAAALVLMDRQPTAGQAAPAARLPAAAAQAALPLAPVVGPQLPPHAAQLAQPAQQAAATQPSAGPVAAPKAGVADAPAAPPPAAKGGVVTVLPASKATPAVVANRAATAVSKPAALPAAAAAAAPQAVLNFAISPWGQVEVNGKAMGASPPLTSLTLPEGVHQVVVRNSDATPFSATVLVSADQPTTVRHRFAP
jgi:eukaryotic-like serine/threonine-protein kinase